MRLLLLSNSTAPGRRYLEHAADALAEVLADVRRVVFVPFALTDHDGYTAQVAEALAAHGVEVLGAHQDDPIKLFNSAQAVFVGGGNTFRLLRELYARELLAPIRDRVAHGTVYIGSSAGTNVACPTIRTTNDMPIVQPPAFEASGLVPFQINPHYLDPVDGDRHMGETREERIEQFLEENDVPVLGMREGTWLRREDSTLTLGGETVGARLFRRGTAPAEIEPGADLSELLETVGRFR
ncbi:dipeptidase PepE [Amycolatopsis acidiphila]|uniref:dipeptidase E n=1 Tax=Amycolatopsis acidiphila TaxID=715473 RepID=A0A558AE65_9PSEU|nr:dipeptidase PepE [Amycolatopsis acidiphila]TVT22554.1 dipeptidase PepE [Amycolatopsis acidiphila]UIJ58809.1 dipeptidase PepE [Amycolatopsis acidiphila]GHG72095.1 peptidase E [Amycolatopsis acidiphila]